ncbi:hypothetical protein KO561_19270 [Radiobacillus kanasensis]|uniref:hypothetical protein n=1 Tax=Radiobacillus kanasensis TaxID=2844358 RepID=UPI001E4DC2ED|nr:hypothetical protein [Radiobacillus kanasensis]UFT99286.1 hypothetical protein KO561_19270 [Radiobacillus kanasensis]
MYNLTLIFLGIGLVLLITSIVLLIMRQIKKNDSFPIAAISMAITGFLLIVVGVVLVIPGIKDKIMEVPSEQEASAQEEGVKEPGAKPDETERENTEREKQPTKVDEYKPGEMKYPIVTYESEYSNFKEYEEADGTLYKNLTMINPDGVMMGFRSIEEAMVVSQVENPNGDEFAYYQGYHYYKGSYHFVVSEALLKYNPNDIRAPYYKDFKSLKEETYDSMDMELYDFIYKFMPLQHPKEENLVQVPILDGDWEAYEETIMDGPQLLVRMSFSDDGYLALENHIVNADEIPDIMNYKFEKLDKNSYKLYLYPVTVDEEGDSVEPVVSEEPVKRNFIIYVTSEDTFELVYYDNNLKRQSITMKRV